VIVLFEGIMVGVVIYLIICVVAFVMMGVAGIIERNGISLNHKKKQIRNKLTKSTKRVKNNFSKCVQPTLRIKAKIVFAVFLSIATAILINIFLNNYIDEISFGTLFYGALVGLGGYVAVCLYNWEKHTEIKLYKKVYDHNKQIKKLVQCMRIYLEQNALQKRKYLTLRRKINLLFSQKQMQYIFQKEFREDERVLKCIKIMEVLGDSNLKKEYLRFKRILEEESKPNLPRNVKRNEDLLELNKNISAIQEMLKQTIDDNEKKMHLLTAGKPVPALYERYNIDLDKFMRIRLISCITICGLISGILISHNIVLKKNQEAEIYELYQNSKNDSSQEVKFFDRLDEEDGYGFCSVTKDGRVIVDLKNSNLDDVEEWKHVKKIAIVSSNGITNRNKIEKSDGIIGLRYDGRILVSENVKNEVRGASRDTRYFFFYQPIDGPIYGKTTSGEDVCMDKDYYDQWLK